MKISIITIFTSFMFAGAYVSYDVSVEANLDFSYSINYDGYSYSQSGSDKVDYDDGGITIGFEGNLKGSSGIVPGISYDIVKMKEGNVENGFINIYGKYYTQLGSGLSAWGLLGWNLIADGSDMAQELDNGDSWEGSYSYGFGVKMKNGLSIGYIFNRAIFEMDESSYYGYSASAEFDGSFQRMVVAFHF